MWFNEKKDEIVLKKEVEDKKTTVFLKQKINSSKEFHRETSWRART